MGGDEALQRVVALVSAAGECIWLGSSGKGGRQHMPGESATCRRFFVRHGWGTSTTCQRSNDRPHLLRRDNHHVTTILLLVLCPLLTATDSTTRGRGFPSFDPKPLPLA